MRCKYTVNSRFNIQHSRFSSAVLRVFSTDSTFKDSKIKRFKDSIPNIIPNSIFKVKEKILI
jgi:S-ribosylhomocysteine lyase LuxS involved in autoinducer biosynthesis